ncbi:DMT family transporter [Microbacterium sp. NPDC055910]|uniref:DMT family transporter n=1 Tax=Microbacterium sp. NPDC055910 TaxID=3345659 RepID=UPI0035D83B58
MSTITSLPVVGIALAVLSAALLSVGNMLQARGVSQRANAGQTLSAGQFWGLIRTPVWLIGTVLYVLSILVQLGALAFAPLMVVQPVGVVALVFSSLLAAWTTKRAPSRREVLSIALCVVSLSAFVTVAAVVSRQTTITDGQLIAVLVVLGVVLALVGSGTAAVRLWRRGHRVAPIVFVILGGVFSAFVATLGKTVILRIQTMLHGHDFAIDSANFLTLGCVAGIVVAGGLSIYYVQTAHTGNSPQVVVGGLTVIDPFVAVVLGITVLQEAAGAPLWSIPVFLLAGAGAVAGVLSLAKSPPTAISGPGQ